MILVAEDDLATRALLRATLERADYRIRDFDNGASALAMTWRVGSITLVGSADLPTGIRNAVRALVDQFIDAYLRVTPRPAGSLAPSVVAPRPAGRGAPSAVATKLETK